MPVRYRLSLLLFLAFFWRFCPVTFAQPDNDFFANALPLSGEEIQADGTFLHATWEPGEESFTAGAHEPSVWWTWRAPRDAYTRISLSRWFGSLRVFEGDSLDTLHQVSGIRRDQFSGIEPLEVTFQARKDTRYSIFVSTLLFDNLPLFFTLSLTAGPANDLIPTLVEGESLGFHSSLKNALPDPGFGSNPAVSWDWIAPRNGGLVIAIRKADRQIQWSLYEVAGATLQPVRYHYASGYQLNEVRQGTRYRFIFFGADPAEFDWDFAFSDLLLLGVQPEQVITGKNAVRLSLTNFPAATDLNRIVLTADDRPVLTNTPTASEFVWLPNVSGRVLLSAYAEDMNGRRFIADSIPVVIQSANDSFLDAKVLTVPTHSLTDAIQDATLEPGEPSTHLPSIWYRFVPDQTAAAYLTISSSSLSEPAAISVYRGDTLQTLSLVTNALSSRGINARLVFPVEARIEYRVAIMSTNNASFTLRLETGAPLLNDNFADRQFLTGTNLELQASLRNATGEPPEALGFGVSTVWYSWTAPDPGELHIRVERTAPFPAIFQPLIRPFTGTNLARLTPVSYAHTPPPIGGEGQFRLGLNELWIPVRAGTNYVWSVWDDGDITMQLQFTKAPTNDSFATPTLLEGAESNIESSLEAVAGETAGPIGVRAGANGGIGRRASWFQWIAPTTGDAYLAVLRPAEVQALVFTGSSLANLTAVTVRASGFGSPKFSAVAGQKYLIAFTQSDELTGFTFAARLSMGPPLNDNFSDRRIITKTRAALIGSSQDASAENGEPIPGQTAWWTWTAPIDGWATLERKTDTAVAVYTGDALNDLTIAPLSASMPKPIGNLQNWVTQGFDCRAGTTYQIMAFRPDPGHYLILLDVTSLRFASPSNNSVRSQSDAIRFELAPVDQTIDGQLDTIWLKRAPQIIFQPRPITNQITLTNDSAGDFTFWAIASNRAGQTRISKPLTLTTRPTNDDFANATPVEDVYETQSIAGATFEPGEPNVDPEKTIGSRWWYWTAPATGEARIEFLDSWFENGLAIFAGNSLAELIQVPTEHEDRYYWFSIQRGVKYCFRYAAPAGQNFSIFGVPPDYGRITWSPLTFVGLGRSEIRQDNERQFNIAIDPQITQIEQAELDGPFPMIALYEPPFTAFTLPDLPEDRHAFFLRAGVKSGTNTYYTLRPHDVFWRPENDDFSARNLFSGTETNIPAKLYNATRETDEPEHPTVGTARSIWWRWIAPTNGVVRIDLADSTENAFLYTGETLKNLEAVESVGTIIKRFAVQSGIEYQLVLASTADTNEIRFRFVPTFTTNVISLTGTNTDFQVSFGNTLPPNAATQSREYEWVSPDQGFLLISGKFDASVLLLTAASNAPLPGTTFIDRNTSVWPVNKNQKYTLQFVAEPQTVASGQIHLDFVPQARNDNFHDALNLGTASGEFPAPYHGTTVEPGEPFIPSIDPFDRFGTVWFKWTAPSNATYQFTTRGPGTLMIFIGSDIANLDLVPGLSDQTTLQNTNRQFLGTAGAEYFVRILGPLTVSPLTVFPEFDFLRIEPFPLPVPPPENDLFAQAAELQGTNLRFFASTRHATREFHEPLHAGIYGGRSIWWKWTAPADGKARLRTTGRLPLLLAIYQGNSVSSLTPIQSRSASYIPGDLSFLASQGSTYYIALDAEHGEEIDTELTFSFVPQTLQLPALSISIVSDAVQLTAIGPQGHPAFLETSSDLLNWTNDRTVSFEKSPAVEINTGPPAARQRFYRLKTSAMPVPLTERIASSSRSFLK